MPILNTQITFPLGTGKSFDQGTNFLWVEGVNVSNIERGSETTTIIGDFSSVSTKNMLSFHDHYLSHTPR